MTRIACMPDRSLQPVLVGLSARMLVQSAVCGGWSPLAADLFSDRDTLAMARRCVVVEAEGFGFKAASLIPAVNRIVSKNSGTALIFSSGLDRRPDILQAISQRYAILGNNADCLRKFNEPTSFFSLLKQLRIPYPEIRYSKPLNQQGWLLKANRSEGGRGVVRFDSALVSEQCYFQRELPGTVMSVLFLADGYRAKIVGFNTQWSNTKNQHYPFLFSGVMNWVKLNLTQRGQVSNYVSKLVEAIGLKGLNSLDFMLSGGVCYVLEINPRPSASMTLYEEYFPTGILVEHVNACLGQMWCGHIELKTVNAYKIIYAPSEIYIPLAMRWTSWSADKPADGKRIYSGHPICSIVASAKGPHTVQQLLRQRESEILRLCYELKRSA